MQKQGQYTLRKGEEPATARIDTKTGIVLRRKR